MSHYYADYIWVGGIPRGVNPCDEQVTKVPICYRLLRDPYGKKLTIEKYTYGNFDACIYDSAILSFKSLLCAEGKELWYRSEHHKNAAIIRNENDQVIVREHFVEEGGHPCTHLYSPHGIYLGKQTLMEGKGILFDAEGKQVI